MPVAIDGPVGLRMRSQNVRNNSRDQEKVIGLLAKIPAAQGGKKDDWEVPPLAGPDGSCPKFLVDAIWNFQFFWRSKGVAHVVDGVVDPGMTSLRKLNELAAGGGDTPPTPVDPQTLPLDIIVRFTGGKTRRRR